MILYNKFMEKSIQEGIFNMNLTVKNVSSLEKIRDKKDIPEFNLERMCAVGGESISYQIAVCSENSMDFVVSVCSPLEDYITLYSVNDVIMDRPFMPEHTGDDFLTDTPGIMPDLLIPLEKSNNHMRVFNRGTALWVKIDIPKDFKPGEYRIEVKLDASSSLQNKDEQWRITQVMNVDVLGMNMPEQKLIFTQWFHTDCIASVHNVKIYSEEHWEWIDKYMAMASSIGINMILTPVITPPLDTGIGKMRPCTQLVMIEKKDDKYSFDFSLLKHWISLCKKNNIKYYEISHLFSQWGLKYSPNIMVTENSVEKLMFGWHIEAQNPLYKEFLIQFLPALTECLKDEGILEACYFHISDEPVTAHLENYRYAYEIIKPLIGNAKIMDAISHVDFCETGMIQVPVTSIYAIDEFLEKKFDNQWAYYCCCEGIKTPNRFISMPSHRTRIIGLLLYKYNIEGFLQWGYNFYFSSLSEFPVNPYVTTSAGCAFPSGDPFSVYPGNDDVLPSLRAVIFKEALQDIELCRKLESYIGKESVVELIEKEAGMEITFTNYPRNNEFLHRVNELVKKEIVKYSDEL